MNTTDGLQAWKTRTVSQFWTDFGVIAASLSSEK